jgi:molecular chaperone DnaK
VIHAREDFKAHHLIDLRLETLKVIRSTEKALADLGDRVGSDEKQKLREAIQKVRDHLEVDDPKVLKALYDELVGLTVPIAEMLMTDVARTMLKDRKIEDVLKEK